jgi:EF hand
VPVFYMGGSDAPARAALVQGGILSLVAFAVFSFALTHWGNHGLPFVIGAHGAFSGILRVDRRSGVEAQRTTDIKVGRDPAEAWGKFVSAYFAENLVLLVLDRNRDLVISADEIADAPARLRMLDVNGTGRLDARACGLVLFREPLPGAEWPKRAALEFMRFHPVMAALDTDHDGEISASEISNSAVALKKLDKNRDGRLTPDEVIPGQYRQ